MGTDASEVAETLSDTYSFKVHRSMCTELEKLVDRVTKIFPEIEAARPRCSSGIQTLCLLNSAIEKAKQYLKYCCDSSKLYLAITGDVIVSRLQRSRNLLEQSLDQIQTMVPVMLAAEISRIIDDLRAAIFILDSGEEEAGKALRDLLQQNCSTSDSVEYLEIKALQLAASRLCITSPKAILLEKKSIKKLLDKVGGNDPTKRKILSYLLYLFKKHGSSIIGEQKENLNANNHGALFALIDASNISAYSQSVEVNSRIGCDQCEAQPNVLSRPTPPEEYKCPISMRLMYDPVVIASGQTFERMWIEKWVDEGNDTCPKTKVKLAHYSLTPNTAMKDLISKWCLKYGITIPDPNVQASQSLDTSYTSIASLGSSMNNINLPLDISNISLGSLDASYSSDSSRSKVANGSSLKLMQQNDNSLGQSYINMIETDAEFLSGLAKLHWESQCMVVENVKKHLQYNDQLCRSLLPENFVEPLIQFLRNAHDQRDIRAQRGGSQLLLEFVHKNRSGISYFNENAVSLMSSFLDSEVIEEALAILEVLSGHQYCRSKITSSDALASILKIVDSRRTEFMGQAITILRNLSSSKDICCKIVSLGCIQKLVPFINDGNLAKYCIGLLKNLCDIEEGRVSVAESNGCIASIAKLLESGSHEEQEHAVAILLSLCLQRDQYCRLVMDEDVIPSLVNISINGNEKGKAGALELLRQFRDIEYVDEQEGFESDLDADRHANSYPKEKETSKTSGFFKNLAKLSKRSALLSRKKR